MSLEEDLTVRAKTTEMKITDFSSGSYATVFRDEVHPHYLSTFHLMHYTFESMPFCNLPLELVTEVLKKANLNTRQYMSLISQNHTNYVVSKVVLAGMAHIWHVRLHAISFFRHVIGSYLYPSSFSPSDVARLLPLPLCKTATSLSVLKDGMGKLI